MKNKNYHFLLSWSCQNDLPTLANPSDSQDYIYPSTHYTGYGINFKSPKTALPLNNFHNKERRPRGSEAN